MPKPNIFGRPFEVLDPATMTPGFSLEHHIAGLAEGWVISQCFGSNYGPWQVQSVDSPDDFKYPAIHLDSDEVAWDTVMRGTEPHHIAAREFIAAHNPMHLDEMRRFIEGD